MSLGFTHPIEKLPAGMKRTVPSTEWPRASPACGFDKVTSAEADTDRTPPDAVAVHLTTSPGDATAGVSMTSVPTPSAVAVVSFVHA